MANLHAAEKPIKDIFHRDFVFSIPPYQRPYSWGTEQAEILFEDLLMASSALAPGVSASSVPPYFLGSIVVIKQEKVPKAEVIDGQQRLTTLSLLIAALRVHSPAFEATLSNLVLERGDLLLGTEDCCRLVLRDRDHEFFEKDILRRAKLDHLEGLLAGKLSDPQRRLAENCQQLVKRVAALSAAARDNLSVFLLQHTYLVVVSTPSLESAFRIFSVLNDRGLDLTVADILKAEVIGKIPVTEQAEYVEKWEEAEEELGTQHFAELFSHIRMIHDRKKLRTSVLAGFRSAVPVTNPKAFIDDDLIPLADASQAVLDAEFECADKATAAKANRALRWLSRIGDRDWMPTALRILTHYASKPDVIASLLEELERLAATLWLLRADENERIERHGQLLAQIAADIVLAGKLPALERTEDEKAGARAVLAADIYHLNPKPKRTFVLLRLDQALTSGEASYDFKTIAVEHVLPQNPPDPSQWLLWWPDTIEREACVHRLGNLALLNGRQNSAAKNWEFPVKKAKYFQKKTGGSPFQITSQVLKEDNWTPAVFARRQEEALSKLSEVWGLMPPALSAATGS